MTNKDPLVSDEQRDWSEVCDDFLKSMGAVKGIILMVKENEDGTKCSENSYYNIDSQVEAQGLLAMEMVNINARALVRNDMRTLD